MDDTFYALLSRRKKINTDIDIYMYISFIKVFPRHRYIYVYILYQGFPTDVIYSREVSDISNKTCIDTIIRNVLLVGCQKTKIYNCLYIDNDISKYVQSIYENIMRRKFNQW